MPKSPSKIGSRQHYVPQFLFRPWTVATGKGEGHVWVYDKDSKRVVDRSPASILYGHGFYDLDQQASFDGFITDRDNDAAPIVQWIRRRGSLIGLDRGGQLALSLFVATQYCRSPRVRATLESLARGTLRAKDGSLVATGPECLDAQYPGLSPKDVQCKWFTDFLFQLARFWFAKAWIVLRAPSANLVIGDHPVVIASQYGGSDGATSLREGTIYLPLSPDLILAFFTREFASLRRDCTRFHGIAGQIWSVDGSIDRKEVDRLDRCQAVLAHRYIVSNIRDFSWVPASDARII